MQWIAERYQQFARTEAAGRSPLYEQLALHVAVSPAALSFLDTLPPPKQQPNLLFAALRLVAGTPSSPADFDTLLAQHAPAIRQVMLTRSTQTNEPGRCAVLMPLLAAIPGDVALIELGASAGLCLLADEYGYDWSEKKLLPGSDAGTYPILPCKVSGQAPLPSSYPNIVWRAGLDLNPIDLHRDEDVQWLELLVWPEDVERLDRLRKAIEIGRRKAPRVIRGDLLRDLQSLISQAPSGASVVVFHSAVLSYVPDQSSRDLFARTMLDSECTWICNESPRVFPEMSRNLEAVPEGMFLLSVNGQPTAWASPHGQKLWWI